MTYKMTDRFFSRLWRRTKRYSEHELRWLCRRHKLELQKKGSQIIIRGPRTLIHFNGTEEAPPPGAFGKLATSLKP